MMTVRVLLSSLTFALIHLIQWSPASLSLARINICWWLKVPELHDCMIFYELNELYIHACSRPGWLVTVTTYFVMTADDHQRYRDVESSESAA